MSLRNPRSKSAVFQGENAGAGIAVVAPVFERALQQQERDRVIVGDQDLHVASPPLQAFKACSRPTSSCSSSARTGSAPATDLFQPPGGPNDPRGAEAARRAFQPVSRALQ